MFPSSRLLVSTTLLGAISVLATIFGAYQINCQDPIVLSSLQQVCENPNGGHLNEPLIRANYLELIELFERNEQLRKLLESRLESFDEEMLERSSLKTTQTLKKQTNALCGVLELMSDFVADKSS